MTPINPQDFYNLTLLANGVTPPNPQEEATKTAEVLGVPTEQVKLATEFYGMLTRDAELMPLLSTSQARAQAAMQMAEKYSAIQEENVREAISLIGDFTADLEDHAEKWAAANGITGLSGADLLQLAALHSEEVTEKVAMLNEAEAKFAADPATLQNTNKKVPKEDQDPSIPHTEITYRNPQAPAGASAPVGTNAPIEKPTENTQQSPVKAVTDAAAAARTARAVASGLPWQAGVGIAGGTAALMGIGGLLLYQHMQEQKRREAYEAEAKAVGNVIKQNEED
jgi:hypothetical protein